MSAMTIKQFREKTGVTQSTLRSKLIALDASPVGVTKSGRPSFLWATSDLEKAFSLVGVYLAPRGRPKKLGYYKYEKRT
jgi:hypothetical protein